MMATENRFRNVRIIAVSVASIAAIAMIAFAVFRQQNNDNVATNVSLAGEWDVTGIDGVQRGVVTLAKDGSFDDGADAGIWIADDKELHVVVWAKRPHKFTGTFVSKPTVESMEIDRRADKTISLVGKHVVMTRPTGSSS
ncbi:hypothetical protein SH139x_004585 [Planctomycetaceae bacterium SH139]